MATVSPAPDDPFEVLFDLSLTGSLLFAPVQNAAGEVTDFAYVRLNPVAQRQLALPERPDESFLARYPHAVVAGVFAFYREAYESGVARRGEFNYQHDGLDNYFHLAARRVGQQLLVSFTDTSAQPRAAVETALRTSQAREHEALAEAERQRQRLHEVLMQLPAHVAVHEGPNQTFTLVNPPYQRIAAGRDLVGQPIREAWPELAEPSGILDMLEQVYQTGEPFAGTEVSLLVDFERNNQPTQVYYNVFFLPLRDARGLITGVLDFSYDVTEQVRARHQTEQLNQELEARVQQRTTQLAAAQAATERQRRQWEDLFRTAPAAICIFDGPEWVYQFVNPGYQALFPGRELLGKPLLAALPELHGQPLVDILHRVYDTGEPFEESEVLVPLARTAGGPVEDIYFDLTYQARRNEAGQVDGFVTYAYDVTEQVLARRAREAQQGELQRIFAQAPTIISVLRGPHYLVELANDQQLASWGRTRSQVLGRPLFEVLPELAVQGFEQMFEQVLTTGQPYVATDAPAQVGPPGETRKAFFSLVFTPLREAAGQVSGIIVVATDTTEQVEARRQVERLNQELEARVQERTRQLAEAQAATEREQSLLQAMFTQAPVAIALFTGEEVRVASANERMAALWGRTPAQVLGRPLTEGVPELQGQGFDTMIREVLATGVPYVGTEAPASILVDGEATSRYYDFVCQPIYDAQGEAMGVINIGTEVTGQVEARQRIEQLNQELETRVQERTRQLTEQQGLLRHILGQVPAAIATVSGPEHRYTFFNKFYQTQVSHRAELSLSVAEALPEVVGQGYLALLDQVYTTGQLYEGREVAFQLHDPAAGSPLVHYLTFVYQPLTDGQGHTTGILLFAIDVTEQVLARRQVEQSQLRVQELNEELAATNEELRATNEELHQSNTRLLRTNHDLDTFVYTASHDLKAPITNIEGILHALRETLPPAVQQDEVVAHIMGLLDHTVGRFRLTIHQLTDLTRLQQTYNEPAEQQLLAPVVTDVLADLAPAVAAAQAQVYVTIPADLQVSFAPASLRSIVYNLLSNAVKYRDPSRPAQVWLRAEAQPGQVVLSVRDNGLGLTESQQGRLFGVFQRLHTHVEGTGVGLYMIKRLIENAGATITVTSTAAVGSTFTVTFPA